MIRLLTAGTRIALVAVAMAVCISVITFAQTPESAIESVPVEAEVAEGTASLAGDEDSTDQDTSVQTEQAGAVEAEIQRRLNEPQDWLSNLESWSTIIRNFGLVIAAVIALWFARWRIVVADRQAATAQRVLLNERYQKGAEMLGSEVLSVRLGGIDALSDLALEHSEDYHTKIMSLLCAFVRHPVRDEEGNNSVRVREDAQEVMTAIHARSAAQIEIEKQGDYILTLPHANLNNVFLHGAKLEGANLTEADLKHANLTGTNLKNCKGLTQEQIDQATVDDDNPPKLEGVVDANTGEPLVWRGRPPNG